MDGFRGAANAGIDLKTGSLARSLACTGALLAGIYFASGGMARADFRVCNDTKSMVGVALGYSESSKWITEGWWQIPGETCASLLEGDLNSQYYYVYAEDAERALATYQRLESEFPESVVDPSVAALVAELRARR